jgi:NAD-dependent dihydropyrimidine dehydrogenase PreA subunit
VLLTISGFLYTKYPALERIAIPPFLWERGFLLMPFAVIVDKEICTGCEKCVEVCTVQVFEMKKGKSVPVNEKDCSGCESCIEVCEEGAVTVKKLPPGLSETARSLLRDIL